MISEVDTNRLEECIEAVNAFNARTGVDKAWTLDEVLSSGTPNTWLYDMIGNIRKQKDAE